MKIDEILNLSYSIYLHKTIDKYNCVNYDFTPPPRLKRAISLYSSKFGFNLNSFKQYDFNQCKIRLIHSYFIKKQEFPSDPTDDEYFYFIDQIKEYKNNISIFVNNMREEIEEFSYKKIHRMYINKKIPFYIFYYFVKFIKLDEDFSSSVLIRRDLILVTKLMLFFKHFDSQWVKEEFEELQKEISLFLS